MEIIKTNPADSDSTEKVEGNEDVGSSEKEAQEDQELKALVDRLTGSNEPEEKIEDAGAASEKKEEVKVESVDVLGEIKKITGREFKDVNDFANHYKNLNSFVGDKEIAQLRKDADAWKKAQQDASQAGDSVVKIQQQDQQKVDLEKDKKVDVVFDELQKLKTELVEERFLQSNPEAKNLIGTIRALADKTGKEYDVVYEENGFKQLLEDQKALEELKSKDLGVKSKSRLAPTKSQVVTDLVKQLQTANEGGRPRDVDALQQKLVSEVLNFKEGQ